MSNEADLQALYPFLHGKPQAPEKLDATLLQSIEEKARDSREANTRFFAAQAPILIAVTGSNLDPAFYLMAGGVIGLLGTSSLRS